MPHRRTPRARAGATACALVASLAAVAGQAAPAAAALPAVTALLGDGAGNGGPAADALVHAAEMFRDADGDLLLADDETGGWRRVDAQTGLIDVTAHQGSGFSPPFPGTHRGQVRVGPALYHLYEGVTEFVVVRTQPGAPAEELHRGPVAIDATLQLLAAHPDGGIVVRRSAPAGTTTELLTVTPDGAALRVLVPYGARLAAVAPDGTVYMVPTATPGRIDAVAPDGTVTEAAGPGTGVVLTPRQLTLTPAGDRLVVVDEPTAGTSPVVRTLAPGGPATTVAAPECPVEPAPVYAEAAAVLVACGGVRSYGLDGSQAPRSGAVVAGLNDVPHVGDSPDGTPLSRAFLHGIRDVATSPAGHIALATDNGVYVIAGAGPDATLERVASPGGRSLAYGPGGTLYVLGANLRAVGPAGDVTVLQVGSGTAYDRVAAGPGGTLWLATGSRVDALNLATNALRWAAGTAWGPAGATSTRPLRTVTWLGSDPVTGDLLVGDGELHRLDAAGVFTVALPLDADEYAVTAADGSVHAATAEGVLWRRRPDGSYAVTAGSHPARESGAVTGPYLWFPTEWHAPDIAGLPDGRLVLSYGVDSTRARVRLLTPQEPAWSGAAPTLAVTAELVNGIGKVSARVRTPTGATWGVHVSAAAGPAGLVPFGGSVALATTVAGGATAGTWFTRWTPGGYAGEGANLKPGQKLYLGLHTATGDGTVAPPPVVVPVTIPRLATALTATGGPAAVTYGRQANLTGRLLDGDGDGLAGLRVKLEARPAGATGWTAVTTVTSDPDGNLVAGHGPAAATDYRWVFAGTATRAPAVAAARTVAVRAAVTATAPLRAGAGATVKVSGTVRPVAAGRVVWLQEYTAGAWRTLAKGRTDAAGAVVLKTPPVAPGTRTYRLHAPASPGLLAGSSAVRKVTVTRT